jgi:iron-sulfur cluster assembly accessory protein
MAVTEIGTELVGSEVNVVDISENAVVRIRKLIEERELVGHALRVFVSGGGCSGMQYGMALEGEIRDTDHSFQYQDVRVVIDPTSISYLEGATIDYVDDLMGGGFRIENPNAVSSCGCGHSFKTEADQGGSSPSAGGCAC